MRSCFYRTESGPLFPLAKFYLYCFIVCGYGSDIFGVFPFLWDVSLPGLCVTGAAAEPERLQEAVRTAARAGARDGRSQRRGASQLHLESSRPVGAAAHV